MQIDARMVSELETAAQEVLMDLNAWTSNPSTVMGFAYGRGHSVAEKMQENIDAHKGNTEQVDSGLFHSYDEYCEFVADLCNSIPAYWQRFMNCWDEQGPDRVY
ncbi:hypothetical protein GHHBBDOD_00147 [Aeromonas phage avDM4]|nr:hypothetical protein GHHBBDOD_00147 [Aeromonas phage avDM4]